MSDKPTITDEQILQATKELAAEKEVGHNTAVALAQQITKLEDQLAAEREWREQMIEQLETMHKQLAAEQKARNEFITTATEYWKSKLAAEREKVAELQAKLQQYEPVQLPNEINDDPVVTLK